MCLTRTESIIPGVSEVVHAFYCRRLQVELHVVRLDAEKRFIWRVRNTALKQEPSTRYFTHFNEPSTKAMLELTRKSLLELPVSATETMLSAINKQDISIRHMLIGHPQVLRCVLEISKNAFALGTFQLGRVPETTTLYIIYRSLKRAGFMTERRLGRSHDKPSTHRRLYSWPWR